MTVFLHFLAILGACALLIGLFIAFVTWAASRLDRAENAASGFQRHEPYVEPPAPYTSRTELADDFLLGDFPQAGVDRLLADIAKSRTEEADPTSPTRLRPTIPAQRKEQP